MTTFYAVTKKILSPVALKCVHNYWPIQIHDLKITVGNLFHTCMGLTV